MDKGKKGMIDSMTEGEKQTKDIVPKARQIDSRQQKHLIRCIEMRAKIVHGVCFARGFFL